MNKKSLAIALLLGAAAWGVQAAEMAIAVSRPVVRKDLPSGSGMSWHEGRYFVVGDDSPWLCTLDRQFTLTGRSLLESHPVEADGRIAKDRKPDYEAMATVAWQGSTWNLILGSGSKAQTRETGLLVATDGKSKPIVADMSALYRDLAALAGFKPGLLVNIEAVAIAYDRVFLFNRGNAGRNMLFAMPLVEFMGYMQGERQKVERVALHEATLPRLNGHEAGFSGADYWPEIDSLVYSASVEGSDNAYDDGAVLGSYLGLIPLAGLKEGAALDLGRSARLLTRQGAAIRTKVESIALKQTSAGHATGALVSDNDDGSSEFFDIVLRLEDANPR